MNSFELGLNPFDPYYKNTKFGDILWNKLPDNEIFYTLRDLSIPINSNLVSCGCGTAQKEIYAAKYYPNIVAFDISKYAIWKSCVWHGLLTKAVFSFLAKNVFIPSIPISLLVRDLFLIDPVEDSAWLPQSIDVWIDWMCFHNMTPEMHCKYAEIINKLLPKKILIRSFSNTDVEFLVFKASGGKGSVLPPNVPGVYRHFTDAQYITDVFSENYELEVAHITHGYDDETLLDKRVSDKITVLLKLKTET